jgi:transcriptional regulator with XRE-family HTH domain
MSRKLTIGMQIRTWREFRKMTQNRLAKLAKVNPLTISALETGRRPDPRISTLLRISKAMDIRMSDLLGAL